MPRRVAKHDNKPIAARLSAEALRQLDELARLWGENRSAAISRAIAYTHTKHLPAKEPTMYVTNASGKKLIFNDTLDMMDNELREALHAEIAPCTDQAFFTAYEAAHLTKFGDEWELSKTNPVW